MTRAASEPMPALPEDVGALQALLRAAWAERDSLAAERDALAEQNDRLRHLLLRLKRLQFGARSERLPDEQLQLGLESLETAIAQGEAGGERRDPGLRARRTAKRRASRLERSTLASWVGYAAAEIAPVVSRLRAIVLGAARVFADETGLPVLDPGRGQTKTGYLWAVARDDRPWGGTDPPAVVYRYAPGRGQQHADTLLGGYRGILQCDGYATYKNLAGPVRGEHGDAAVTLVFCWAHVRRGFYDLAKTGTAPIATEALARIAALYRIEAEVRGQAPAQRLAARRERSQPLVTNMRAWFERQLAKLPGRGPTAGAIRYALNHWDGLVRFLDDGRIELDTNTVERAIRPVKLSRKNALFAGSDEGGSNWAHVASVVETCKLNGVDPQAYLCELLTRLVGGWPQARIDALMPWHWAAQRSG